MDQVWNKDHNIMNFEGYILTSRKILKTWTFRNQRKNQLVKVEKLLRDDKMIRKIRTREAKNDAKLLLLKYLPWLFVIMMFLLSSTIGVSVTAGPNGPGME